MIRIATRASELALWQANFVRAALEAAGERAELVPIETRGDTDQRPFRELSGTGFFTKAVQEAVIDGRADLAVHSYKDLPSDGPAALTISAVPRRADPRDVLLIRPDRHDPRRGRLPLAQGAVVGTSAARRRDQLSHHRPDLEAADLRGNVPTRVQKLRAGQYDAIVLAAAGLERLRLDLSDLVVVTLEPGAMVPAPAQGALALETRRGDERTAALLGPLHDPATHELVAAERGLMALLDAGCQLALGAYAWREGDEIALLAWYEGNSATVRGPSPEEAARAAREALARAGALPARRGS